MRICLFVLLSIFYFQSHSQDVHKLDENLNFHGFRFGSTSEAFDNDLTLYLTISYGTKYYKYHGKLVKDLNNLKTHEINLGFHDDQLIYLDLYFKKLNNEEFAHLLQSLENDYGSGEEFTALDKGVISAIKWEGDNLAMQLYHYGSLANDEDDRNMTVLSFEKQSY